MFVCGTRLFASVERVLCGGAGFLGAVCCEVGEVVVEAVWEAVLLCTYDLCQEDGVFGLYSGCGEPCFVSRLFMFDQVFPSSHRSRCVSGGYDCLDGR